MSTVRRGAKARPHLFVLVVGAVLLTTLPPGPGLADQPASAATVAGLGDPAGGTGSFVLTATNTGATYAPTFTGNGELGLRVPPAGQGYSDAPGPTPAELAGFYAQPGGAVQQRANIPTWSTLTLSVGGQPFDMASGHTSRWRQSINLRTGVITTNARWTAPDGDVTGLTYQVLTDRARPQVGLVRLELTPRWSGTATVTDAIDGSPATLSTQVGKGWSSSTGADWVSVETRGTNLRATLASRLEANGPVKATATPVDQAADQSVGQQLTFAVLAGHNYTFTKYVGVAMSAHGDPTGDARQQAQAAATTGFAKLLAANDAAWRALWSDRIDVLGAPGLATDVNASEFYLWSSTGDGVNWSISPAGLSANSYNGHVFWDADTWMYPALLAQHPDLAAGMNTYRYQRLTAAETHAAAGGYAGARYPWESALAGTEQIPPPSSLFSEGLYEQHVSADIALAQWQYFLATGDRAWLARRGWPVLSQVAAFWASRVTPGADGKYHINGVTGPDEENANVDDEAYTNVAAKSVLEDATLAARVLGVNAPALWASIASRIVVPQDSARGIIPEFSGYNGGLVKQADVTLLQYPWDDAMPSGLAQNDLNYYAPRADPNGPSMTDAVNAVDTLSLSTAGCAGFVFTERSEQPFIRDAFDQFSETATGGAFTFMTGIGGFLQEFIYGYPGLRWNAGAVHLAPTLTSQLGGVVLHGVSWHGRLFSVAIGPKTTSITLTRGAVMPVTTASGRHDVRRGQALVIPTRRPDRAATTDAVRCAGATASSSRPGAPALAAVDGSPATDWQPLSVPATLTAPLTAGPRVVSSVTIQWGQRWPEPPGPVQPPPPGPPTTLRASGYTVAVSLDGRHWHTVARVDGRTSGTTDVLHFARVRAAYITVRISASSGALPPMVDELTVR